MTVPMCIESILYSSIYRTIESLHEAHNNGQWSDRDGHAYLEVTSALDWYNGNVNFSSQSLSEALQSLKADVNDNYLIYDTNNYHRFTLIINLMKDKKIIEYNQLLHRDKQLVFVKDIQVGKIITHNGFHAKIINVYNGIDKEHGRFTAETLSVNELKALKKRRNGGY